MSATAQYASKLATSMIAPDLVPASGVGIPSSGAPKHAVTVGGAVSMTANEFVTSAVAYIDPLSFRAGQLELVVVGKNAAGEAIQCAKGDVGTASTEFASGAVMSLVMGAENTSGDNLNSGTVAVGVLSNTLGSAVAMTGPKLERQTETNDFMRGQSRDGELLSVGISPYFDKGMAHVGTSSSTHQTILTSTITGSLGEGGSSLYLSGKGLRLSTSLDLDGDQAFTAGTNATPVSTTWWSSETAYLHTANVALRNSLLDGVHKKLKVTLSVGEKAGAAYLPAAHDVVVTFADNTTLTTTIIAAGTVENTVTGAITHATGVVDLAITTPIKKLDIVAKAGATARDLASFGLNIETTYENSDIPETPRCMAVFDGITQGSVLSVRCSALLAVTPADDQLRLMQRPPVDPEVNYSDVIDYLEAVLRHAPGAYRETGRSMLLSSMGNGAMYSMTEQAFSIGDLRRRLKPISRSLSKFAKEAKNVRGTASDYAHRLQPILDMSAVGLAAEAPMLAAGAGGASALIDALRDTTIPGVGRVLERR